MPWGLALPFKDRERQEGLMTRYHVSGFPHLVILDPQGQILAADARDAVSRDPTGKNFPWRDAHVVRDSSARSVAHRALPKVPQGLASDAVSLVLFYQYMEPAWTPSAHRHALAAVIAIADKHGVTGRGRCAPEGLNCTLTGSPEGIRGFCEGLRTWNPTFQDTDFKITDGLDPKERFKALTVRKTEELVGYGLAGDRAPALATNKAEHLEATDYHEAMKQPNTVIVDVRNYYESAIGHFNPPEGGAELIDPKLRNSHEFPRWLNMPETQEKLKGKKVLMYCTGGIRCERASALLDQMTEASPELNLQSIAMVRGGIERYMKTYPEGGFWKGKNYLFDRRFEQVPEAKSSEALKKDIESYCCVCHVPWDQYRGQNKCSRKDCKVPVLVCTKCRNAGQDKTATLLCPLCETGYDGARKVELPSVLFKNKKRNAEQTVAALPAKRNKEAKVRDPSERLFVGNMPYTVTLDDLEAALGGSVKSVEWLLDRDTELFYGSCFVQLDTLEEAKRAIRFSEAEKGIRVQKRKLKVGFAPLTEGETWPKPGHLALERPPVRCY